MVVGVLGGAVLTLVPQEVDGGADPPAAQAGAPVAEMVVIVTGLVAQDGGCKAPNRLAWGVARTARRRYR